MNLPAKFRERQVAAAVPEAIEFQDHVDALMGEQVPKFLALWPLLGALLLAALLMAAAVTSVDIVVTATGRLAADEPPVVLQPAGAAVLRDLRVRPGDRVVAGQLVAVLDSTFTDADRTALEAQKRALVAEQERLSAELASREPEVSDAASRLQHQLGTERAAVLTARRTTLAADLAALETALESEQAVGGELAEQVALAREVEAMRERLAQSGSGSRLNLLEARSSRLAMEMEARRHEERIAALKQQRVAKTAEIALVERDWKRQILEEMAALAPKLAAVHEQLAKAARLDSMTLLRAPRDGVVLEIAERAPGSLMREGETVASLVPTGAPLIAEVVLRSADIGRLGQDVPAVLKIDAFPWRRFGTVPGQLRSISRESYAPGEGALKTGGLHRGANRSLGKRPARSRPRRYALTWYDIDSRTQSRTPAGA